MEPIIKWPGGKSDEYSQISQFFPKNYSRYIEPFFGGGAVFFRLAPQRSVINDICSDLIEIYRFLGDSDDREKIASYLLDYADNWEKIPKFIGLFEDKIITIYKQYRDDTVEDLAETVNTLIKSRQGDFNGLFAKSFCLNDANLQRQICRNTVAKLQRMVKLEDKFGKLSDADILKNIETAFRSGFYMHFRDVLNHPDQFQSNKYKRAANFYFIREFCYGSMFRFNKNGEFNVPYGGIAYNKKQFSLKVKYATSDEVFDLLHNAEIYSDDFDKVLNNIELGASDFIFLDPPYDTEFKDYNNDLFDKKDQERLAKFLYITKAKFVLVIKATDFIKDLYSNRPGIYIESFDKAYQYNVKGRNNRAVKHLVIRNFQ